MVTKYCIPCGYILDYLHSHRCPECGAAFNPDVPSSFSIKNPRHLVPPRSWRRTAEQFLIPPGIVWIGTLLTRLGIQYGMWSLIPLYLMGVIVCALTALILAIRFAQDASGPIAARVGFCVAWLVLAPLTTLLGITLIELIPFSIGVSP